MAGPLIGALVLATVVGAGQAGAAAAALDRAPPKLVSATVKGSTMTLTYDEQLAPPPPEARAYSITHNGRSIVPKSVRTAGRAVLVTLPIPAFGDDEVVLSFHGEAADQPLRDRSGNRARGFWNRRIESRGPPGCLPYLDPGTSDGRYTESPLTHPSFLRSRGRARGVMLFVDFPDAPATEPVDVQYERYAGTASSWYGEMSYGRLNLELTPVRKWFRMPLRSADYRFDTYGDPVPYRAYIEAAVALADPDVDFGPYDLLVVVASAHAALRSGAAFSFLPGHGLRTLDGKELLHAVGVTTDDRDAGYTLAHEVGHHLGLPDLYTGGAVSSTTSAGWWDLMSSQAGGRGFLAWHRYKLGWLDGGQLRCVRSGSRDVTLTPLAQPGGVKAVVLPLTATAAYVVESRQRLGADATLCDRGVLVYRIDSGVRTGDGPVQVAAAQPDPDPALTWTCGPLYAAAFDLGPGEVSVFEDAAAKVRVELLSESGGSYRLRVTRG